MITASLINNSIPRLKLEDTVYKALQLMNDYRVSHLPVASESNYLGLISEEDLLDADDEKMPLQLLEEHFNRVSVPDNVFFLNAVQVCSQFDVSLVPVINATGELQGVITLYDLIKKTGEFAGADKTGGVLVLEMLPVRFSSSEISRIIENNDCNLLHLNMVTHPETGLLTVTIQVNKTEIASLIASFERYQYDVVMYFGKERFESEIRTNYENLLNYLNI